MYPRAFVPVVFLAALVLVGCGGAGTPAADVTQRPTAGATSSVSPTPPKVVTIQIRNLVIEAEVAYTPEERGQGLSDRPSLDSNAGMLFYLFREMVPGFYMRNMQFPLDFIWISGEGTVADVTENVPDPATAGETISGISPSVPVLFALEVNAGTVSEAGIQVGDPITFAPDILQ